MQESIGWPILSPGNPTEIAQYTLQLQEQEPYAYQQLPRRQQRPQTPRRHGSMNATLYSEILEVALQAW